MCSAYMSKTAKRVSELHSDSTNQKSDFYVRSTKTFSASIFRSGANEYNKLSRELKTIETVANFKKELSQKLARNF